MDEDIKILGKCTECGNVITDETEVYVNEDGEYFDSIECVMEYYKITKLNTEV